jgi:hypothetical protein
LELETTLKSVRATGLRYECCDVRKDCFDQHDD